MIPLEGYDGIVLALPVLAVIALLAPGVVRDVVSHLTRKDLPE